MKKRNLTALMQEIKNEIPNFDKKELLEYTEWVIPKLYDKTRGKTTKKIPINCTQKVIDKMKKHTLMYRINKNIDRISVQYVELYDYEKKEDIVYMKIYVSIFFHDILSNNDDYNKKVMGDSKHNYWNDIWIVTYREKNTLVRRKTYVCENCGAPMKFNRCKDVFECKYCKNEMLGKQLSNWEITDIEVYNK